MKFVTILKSSTSSVLLLMVSSCFWVLQSNATTIWECGQWYSNYYFCEDCIGDERYSCIDHNEVIFDQCQMRVFVSCQICEGGSVVNDCNGGLNTCFDDKKCILESNSDGLQVCSLIPNQECYCKSTSSTFDCDGDLDRCFDGGMRCVSEGGTCQLKHDFNYCCPMADTANYISCSGIIDTCEGSTQCRYTGYIDGYAFCEVEENSVDCSGPDISEAPSTSPTPNLGYKHAGCDGTMFTPLHFLLAILYLLGIG